MRRSQARPHAAQPRRQRRYNGDDSARRQALGSPHLPLSRQNEAATGEIRVAGEVGGVRLVLEREDMLTWHEDEPKGRGVRYT